MREMTDAQLIERIDVRVNVAQSEVQPGGREIQVRVFSAGAHPFDLYDQPFLAQLDGEDWGEAAGQLSDDFSNNAELDDKALIRAFSFEFAHGDDEADFENARVHIDDVISEHAINVAQVTIDAVTGR